MSESLITGLDIGSTTTRIAVAQVNSLEEKALEIIAASEYPTEGFSRDSVVSIDDAVSSISSALERAERTLGVPVESAWVGISGAHIQSRVSKGVVAVGKVNGEVVSQDVERAIEAAKALSTPPNYEVLHVVPRSCVVDDQAGIKDPIGMSGVRLEVDTLIVQGLASQIKNFTKCVFRSGLEINDLVFSVLATSEVVLDGRQKDLGVMVIDIGGDTTSLAIYEEGEVFHTAVLPLGSEHITSDIAIGLRVSLETAERIKLQYGTLLKEGINKKETFDMSLLDPHEQGEYSLMYICEIIEARVEEIFDKIKLELKRVGRTAALPAGIVLTGGGSKMPGMVEMAKSRLKLPAREARLKNSIHGSERILDQSFTTAIGLCHWGWIMQQRHSSSSRFSDGLKVGGDFPGRVKKWLKTLLP